MVHNRNKFTYRYIFPLHLVALYILGKFYGDYRYCMAFTDVIGCCPFYKIHTCMLVIH